MKRMWHLVPPAEFNALRRRVSQLEAHWTPVGRCVMMGPRLIATAQTEYMAELICELRNRHIPITNLLTMAVKRLGDAERGEPDDKG